MASEEASDLDLLAFRKDFIRREIDVSISLNELSDKLSNVLKNMSSEYERINNSVNACRQEFAQLKSDITKKLEFIESITGSQNRQIDKLNEERSIMLREITALNEYIAKITDRHHAKQNELQPKPEADRAALKVLADAVEAIKEQAIGSRSEILDGIKSILARQNNFTECLDVLIPAALPQPEVAPSAVAELPSDTPEIDPADVDLLLANDLFNGEWYRNRYSLELTSLTELAFHYLSDGFRHGFSPSSEFDGRAYLAVHHDVMMAGLNPLIHYIKYGKSEGRVIMRNMNTVMTDLS